VQNWEIKTSVAVSPTDASECDAAYLVKVAYGEEQAEVIVEFATPAAVASVGYAEEVTRKFLGDDEPPRRIVVERDGGEEDAYARPERSGETEAERKSVPVLRAVAELWPDHRKLAERGVDDPSLQVSVALQDEAEHGRQDEQ